MDEIRKIIDSEDEKNPYTDEKISKMVGLRREKVTLARQAMRIPDSRERKRNNIILYIKKLINVETKISERELTEKVNEHGFKVSRYVIREIKKEVYTNQIDKKPLENVTKKNTHQIEKDVFLRLVGFDGSLSVCIKQAKAAMLYPPRGLHTLILGETGVGKSDLANAMFDFAKESQVINKEANFIVFNCADYADNPELLMSQLFGYKKGSFTGAIEDKEGLVEKANNSILFLDEIHRLPPEGQEQLFYLIDKSAFRRLGETNAERKADVTIIAATTEKPELSLLNTFRRRIPMVIEIPNLRARPLSERLEVIKNFSQKEASRVQKKIIIHNEAVKALLLFDCTGNLGQLKSELQVSCAKSFFNHIVLGSEFLYITVEELSSTVETGLMHLKNFRREIDEQIGSKDLNIYPQDNKFYERDEDIYVLPEEIYTFIEKRYNELQAKQINPEVINYIVGSEIDKKLKYFFRSIEDNNKAINKKDLINILGVDVLNTTDKVIKIANRRLSIDLDSLYYILAVHLSTTIQRINEGKVVKNPKLQKIKREYVIEFRVALEMIKVIEDDFNITLPEDEAGFIALYLRLVIDGNNGDDKKGNVGVVVASHGSVASGMASVANQLLGVKHAKYIEMSLDENPQSALDRTVELVKDTDLGKGVLLLVDMGSLVTFGDLITERTGIKTRTIPRTDTVMVIEAVRRAILPDADLDHITNTLLKENKYISTILNQNNKMPNEKRKIIITLCITGHGASMMIKEILENTVKIDNENIEIRALGVLNKELKETIKHINQTYNVIAIIGTVNPRIDEIPFITIDEMLSEKGKTRFNNIVESKSIIDNSYLGNAKNIEFKSLLNKEYIFVNVDVSSKEEGIAFLAKRLLRGGYVKEEYIDSVYSREEMAYTYFKEGISIPHGDPIYVIKPIIAIAKLSRPIEWDENYVETICMMTVNNECICAIEEFYDLFDGTSKAKELKEAVDKNQIYKLLAGKKEDI
ncbi:PRD domain-containing protein [Alkalibaculum sp. M08DMB]|uniref:PRD domain-containing protein n=1 Tax=Alkalibaculum sporogenes TaxID=2655001 RepID=A0A6A7KCU9_9FIRM|nr:sigma 54-interacting transcriptional regulator [Alkalibaculum sporogenes]MPW26997.1 PRD domain-containing protein [Alkalibaculum sporogenes]